jgi:hypothetical protein
MTLANIYRTKPFPAACAGNAAAGHEWGLANYSPKATVERFMQLIERERRDK